MDGLEYPVTDVAFPQMRLQIAASVARLADSEYQRRVWVGEEWPSAGFYDDAANSIEWLDENTLAFDDPEGLVGQMLFPDEVLLMSLLAVRVRAILDDLGIVDSATYLSDPRWPAVLEVAGRLRAIMERNGGYPLPEHGLAPVRRSEPERP